jgi:antibiotic biosynthesis monooxygenase (ABM) superfamily enzyme
MDQVHFAITRRIKPGMESEFEAALREFASQSLHADGTTGVHLIGPAPDGRDYGILRSFESVAASDAFYASELFQNWEQRVAHLVEGPSVQKRLHGLEAFFREPGRSAPPRWKMAVVTWLGVFPTVWLWSSSIPKLTGSLPSLATMAVVNVFVVITLAWFAMPLLVRVFDKWLHGNEVMQQKDARHGT